MSETIHIEPAADRQLVFSAPVQQGDYQVITVSQHVMRKNGVVSRPVALVILKPEGVEVRYFHNRNFTLGMAALITAFITWGAVMMFHPPWRPDSNLVDELRELIAAAR